MGFTTSPLAEQLLENPALVDSQEQSPLFRKLPPEIRYLVWEYAFTHAGPFKPDGRYFRPGQCAPLNVATGFLRTCRAAYVEAAHFPVALNPLVVYYGDKSSGLSNPQSIQDILRSLPVWQLPNIRSVDLTVRQDCFKHVLCAMHHSLALYTMPFCNPNQVRRDTRDIRPDVWAWNLLNRETIDIDNLTKSSCLRPEVVPTQDSIYWRQCAGETDVIERLKTSQLDPQLSRRITKMTFRIRRYDWLFPVGHSCHMALDPCLRFVTQLRGDKDKEATWDTMLENAKRRRSGSQDLIRSSHGWGSEVELFKGLEVLEMVLESPSSWASKLDDIVECAKLWTFSMDEEYELSQDGEVGQYRWSGKKNDHSGEDFSQETRESDDFETFVVKIVSWKRRKVEG